MSSDLNLQNSSDALKNPDSHKNEFGHQIEELAVSVVQLRSVTHPVTGRADELTEAYVCDGFPRFMDAIQIQCVHQCLHRFRHGQFAT